MRVTPPDSARRTVLIVDDDPVSREVLTTVLTAHGCAVESAANGREALTALAGMTDGPQVLLADLQMEGLGGANLIAALRARTPRRTAMRTRTCIVAMSATRPRAGEAASADGFLLKPFAPRDLDALLASIPQAANAGQNPEAGAEQNTEPDTEVPVLDQEILRQFRNLMLEPSVRQTYDTALEDMGARLEEIAAAIGQSDQEKLRRIGHALKGSCGMIGARQAALLGAQLEEGAEAVTILAHLRNALENLKNRVQSEFGDCVGGDSEE